ncbi:hypothetical protein WEI85_28220 [Actinomycetes bacterium KLBMP 9797]
MWIAVAVLAVAALTTIGIMRTTRSAAETRVSLTETSAPGLYTSTRPDRGDAVPLNRAVVRDKIYVVAVAGGAEPVTATFWLDSPAGQALRAEKTAPFDLAGGAADGSANAFDTTTLRNGPHILFVEMARADGSTVTSYATFTVDNAGKALGAAPTPSASPTPTPKASASPDKPATGGGRCALPAYPSPSCTGVPDGTKLTTINGEYAATKAGEVISGKRITGRVSIRAKNVVIRDSELLAGVNNFTGSGSYPYTIEDSTVGPASGCYGDFAIGAENFTARRVLIRNSSDGFRVSGDNILIEHSFAKVCTDSSNHSDGIQGHNGGSNVVIRHNTVDQRGVENATSPIFIADGSQGAKVADNLLMGGGYVVRLHDGSFTFENNAVVDKAWGYGPVYSNCGAITWRGNKLVQIDQNYRVTKSLSALNCRGTG